MPSFSPFDMITMDHIRAIGKPKGIAMVGATERPGSVGRTCLENLMKGKPTVEELPYALYPVNPTRETCLGLKCYPSVSAIDTGKCEAALVVTPAAKCLEVVKDCTKNPSMKVLIILAAGFKEIGEVGLKLENELVELAAKSGLAIVGPNCLGVMSPIWSMNATFAVNAALPGKIAFLSQSGAMCTAVLDWSFKVGMGFSAFVSIGSMAHVQWSHFLEYYGHDENTSAIIMYMETIGDANLFMHAARKVAAKKPLVVIKAGKTMASAAAAVSHTGSLIGTYSNFTAAMARVGVLVVDSIEELQTVALIASTQPLPTGNGLYIITNAGGPGVISTDAAAMIGLELRKITPTMIEELNEVLPSTWSHANPMDLIGDAKTRAYRQAVKSVFEHGEKGSSLLIVLSPQAVTEPESSAEAICEVIKEYRGKTAFDGPIVCAWMGGVKVEPSFKIFAENDVPCFYLPENPVRCIGLIYQQVVWAHTLPPLTSGTNPSAKLIAKEIIHKAAAEKRKVLTETESKSIMKAYGIPVAESIVCHSADDAVKAANQVKYPCVMKVNSETLTHKSDVGGVKLGISTDEEVRTAYKQIKENVDKVGPNHFQGVSVQPMLNVHDGVELLCGSTNDNQFGPMVLFGAGGTSVEVFKDVANTVPPLDRIEVERLVQTPKIYKALQKGVASERFKGCPMEELYDVLMKFADITCDLWDEVPELEINPLLALPDRIVALDARVVLKDENTVLAPPCQL